MKKRMPSQDVSKTMDRRAFLRLSGLLSLGVASAVAVPVSAEAVRFNRKMYKVTKTRLAMGTFVSMTLIHSSRDEAEEAMGRAFDEMDRLTRMMSRFDDRAYIARLNSDGYLPDTPPEVHQLISQSLHYHRVSHGAFDITVKPIVDLFAKSFSGETETPPSDGDLERALRLVDAGKIRLEDHSIRLDRAGMGITLDGIAKGYIVDRASRVLSDHHVENHLINAGGDIRTMGSKAPHKPWTVAIQDPEKKKHYPDVLQMNEGAIATSGNYEVYYDQEKMFHHIVDPATGRSPQGRSSVSVLAKTAAQADALSTSVFVMPSEEGISFINGIASCECLVISKDGRQMTSRGWKHRAT
jgi:thiamine biosynthesis lipoprotein